MRLRGLVGSDRLDLRRAFRPPSPSPQENHVREHHRTNTGRIIEIKGVVIDAVFPDGLPEIYTALEIEIPEGDTSRTLVAEVQQHLGDDRVRAVAMDSTDGLARGAVCVDTGRPISVPVGAPHSAGSGT